MWGQLAQFSLSVAIFVYSEMRKSAINSLLSNNVFFYYCYATLIVSFSMQFIMTLINATPSCTMSGNKDDSVWVRVLTWMFAISTSLGKVAIVSMSSLFLNLHRESGTAAFSCAAAAIAITTLALVLETMFMHYTYKTAEGLDFFKMFFPGLSCTLFHTPSFVGKYERFAKREIELHSLLAHDDSSILQRFGLDIDDLVRGPPSYASELEVQRHNDAAVAAIEALTHAAWRQKSP
tara:strand:+ start:504 stop:1208 length:705 start_codon:yes stop_codon:yes gene_type:complete